tara:strand:- start:539 stop:802 length:264 start_codon:yes stop_codon:yes gene_type:complete
MRDEYQGIDHVAVTSFKGERGVAYSIKIAFSKGQLLERIFTDSQLLGSGFDVIEAYHGISGEACQILKKASERQEKGEDVDWKTILD